MIELVNEIFVLVNNFKMIGVLLNVVHGQVKKTNKNLGFPNHSTLINYDETNQT